jgi:hypothetical protein
MVDYIVKTAPKEWAEGDKRWYRHGKLHRVNGPATERADGTKEWYLNGRYIKTNQLAYASA